MNESYFWAIFATSDLVMNILKEISIFKINIDTFKISKNVCKKL